MLLNVAKCQGYKFYCFRVIEGKPTGGGEYKFTPLPPSPPPHQGQLHIRVFFNNITFNMFSVQLLVLIFLYLKQNNHSCLFTRTINLNLHGVTFNGKMLNQLKTLLRSVSRFPNSYYFFNYRYPSILVWSFEIKPITTNFVASFQQNQFENRSPMCKYSGS